MNNKRDQSGHESIRVPSTNDLSKMGTMTGEGMEEDPERWPKPRKRTNDLIGTPSEVNIPLIIFNKCLHPQVALLRYVELVASVEGIRNRYKVGHPTILFHFYLLFLYS